MQKRILCWQRQHLQLWKESWSPESWRRELSSLTQSTSAAHAWTECVGLVSSGCWLSSEARVLWSILVSHIL